MKRIPALFLFAILLVNSAGFYVYYVIALQRIHREMRAQLKMLPDEMLTRIVLSTDEYSNSLVEDDEIKVKGKMFDVARIDLLKDFVIVFGMYDEKEDDLLAFVNEIISKPLTQDSNVTGSVLQFIALSFLPGQSIDDLLCHGKFIAHDSDYNFPMHSLTLQHEAPPPRCIV
jgi:hypothetical protein